MDPKKSTTVAKRQLKTDPIPYSGSAVDLEGETYELGKLCWEVCVSQHQRRVQGRKEGRRKRGQNPDPS